MMLVIRNPEPESDELAYVQRALEAGELVVVPTDTVYGIAALASDEEAVSRLYSLKGRDPAQPTAAVFSDHESLHQALPGLGKRARWAIASLLPGPWTLVVRNPVGHFPWLTGGTPGAIGVRIPAGSLHLPPIAATSANAAGEPTAASVDEIDPSIASALACAVDRGPLPAEAESTVLDLQAWEAGTGEAVALRDGPGRLGQALAVLADAP